MIGNGTSGIVNGQVHWHEGLFLQPHHLQCLQRQVGESLAGERRFALAYPYGLIESRLSHDALGNSQVRFDQLRAVMPSGLYVDVAGNADLPVLDIKRVLQASSAPVTVSLAVPVWQSARANTIETRSGEGSQIKRLFRVSEIDRADENTGENRQPLLVRRINARLVVEGDDTADLEVLPVLRVIASAGDEQGRPMEDKHFIPPCLTVSGSATLRLLVRDLGNKIESVRRETVTALTRGGAFSRENLRGIQIDQLMRLRTLNRAAVRVPMLATVPGVTPLEACLELCDVLSDLAALGIEPSNDAWLAPRYDHDNPGQCFYELDRRLRPLLAGRGGDTVQKLAFQREGDIFTATLEDKHITKPTEYFLGIRTKQDPVALARLVESRSEFKFMSGRKVMMAMPGVRLEEDRHPPYELPSQPGLYYFKLVRPDSPIWNDIVTEKKAAIRRADGGPVECEEMALYMTVPPEE